MALTAASTIREPRSRQTSRRRGGGVTSLGLYLVLGLLSATGGLRPTGIAWVDAVLLGLGGAAMAACAVRAATVPIYLAAGAAALCQPAAIPLALGCVALGAALLRRYRPRSTGLGALAGGLAWASAVGAPFESGASPVFVPMVAFAWVVLSSHHHGSRRFRKRLGSVALVVLGVAVVGAGLGVLAVLEARADVERGADLVESGLAAARAADSAGAISDLREGSRALSRGESSLGALWARPAWLVPGVSQNARALHTIVREVGDLARVGITSAETADLSSVRARSGQIDLAAVQRVESPLRGLLRQLVVTEGRLDRLVGQPLVSPIAARLSDLRAEVSSAIPSAELAVRGVEVVPGLLGGDGPRTYLVLFTTPVEARGRTGFPGNFAEVTFTDGRFSMTRFGRISELDPPVGPPKPVATVSDAYQDRYVAFEADRNWRNITISPDFPTVASIAMELYPQSGGRPIDGVMSVDPVALGELLRFTGPIAVPGVDTPLDSTNAARFLLHDQYVDLPDSPERVDVLEHLARATFERLTTVELPAPDALGEIFGPVVAEGHLKLATADAAEMAFLDQAGLSGRFPAVEGDFVAVTTTNAAMSKIDVFLRRELGYEVHWDPATGELSATATITLTNDAPASGLPPYLIGNNVGLNRPHGQNLPDGWNDIFVTLYSPWWPESATIDGEPLALQVLPELDRQAISTFVELGPGATTVIRVELAGVLDASRYVLDLAAQPLVTAEQAAVSITVPGLDSPAASGPVSWRDGSAVGEFPLVRDTTVTVSP